MLKHRFLIHSLHYAWVVVDIARYSLPPQINREDEGTQQMVPSLRFGSWNDAERYFLALGAKASMIEETSTWLGRCGVAVLTVMSQPEGE